MVSLSLSEEVSKRISVVMGYTVSIVVFNYLKKILY
jgi:hypothetical protein